MKNKLNYQSLFLSVLVGLVIILIFAYISGSQYATGLFPEMALLAGFLVSGFIIGITSKGVTIIEPGLGSVIVAVLSYFLIPLFQIDTFSHIWQSDWVLIYLNGITLSFVGAWLGEMMQHGDLNENIENGSFRRGWIVAGLITGVTVGVLIVNVMNAVWGDDPVDFIIPFFISLFITGFVIGWKSSGTTIKEAGISSVLTGIVIFDITRLTLITEEEIGVWYIILGLLLGAFVSLLGAWLGERLQGKRDEKKVLVDE